MSEGKRNVLVVAVVSVTTSGVAIYMVQVKDEIDNKVKRLDSFMDRMEGFLERDEQRELRP